MAVIGGWAALGLKDVVCGTTLLQQRQMGAVLTQGYVFDQDTHHYLTSAMSAEVTAGATVTGYTSFGCTVTGSTVSYDGASNEIRWTFANPKWTSASFSASGMVIYDRFAAGTTTTWPILMYVEFGGTQTVSSGTFEYQVPATGAGIITVGTPSAGV